MTKHHNLRASTAGLLLLALSSGCSGTEGDESGADFAPGGATGDDITMTQPTSKFDRANDAVENKVTLGVTPPKEKFKEAETPVENKVKF